MQKQTIISTPSISDTNVLMGKWSALPGNSGKTAEEFYSFLTVESVERDKFLSDYTVESYNDIKGNIVVLKIIPR